MEDELELFQKSCDDGPKVEPSESASFANKIRNIADANYCLICSDKATGKHYGSISCDGCKGFFRRTIRKKQVYVCRFGENCVVDKDMRNSCRSCRFSKCLSNGMRREAVQLERDRLSARRPALKSLSSQPQTNGASDKTIHEQDSNNLTSTNYVEAENCLRNLMEAEYKMREVRNNTLVQTRNMSDFRVATTGDITESVHQQLILLVEWAKHLKSFRQFPLSSQIGLLRNFAAQHLIICAAFRSMGRSMGHNHDVVWLTNESCLPRDDPKIPDINRVAAHLLDHLISPMRRLLLEEKEYVALKAVAFFDPLARDVEDSAAEVEKTRQEILSVFEFHVTQVSKHRDTPHRLANLLLLLPQLVSISRDFVEEAQLAKVFGLANVDELMAELLLPSSNTYNNLKSSVTAPSTTLSNSIASSPQTPYGPSCL